MNNELSLQRGKLSYGRISNEHKKGDTFKYKGWLCRIVYIEDGYTEITAEKGDQVKGELSESSTDEAIRKIKAAIDGGR